MTATHILRELLDLYVRPEIPVSVRASIAERLGVERYEPAKEALLAGLADPSAELRSACIRALAIDWGVVEIGPRLVEILLNDEHEFVRMDAAAGLGTIRYRHALQSLKSVTLSNDYHMSFREAAYEAILSILGRGDEEEDSLERLDRPTVIDWDLVRSL